ncbi:MAG: NACHT domain-containing protein [Gammaproteobacteria bacterium]|nr:NACHT domain-containing protein [Gammaproteobacteria bacterium]
MKSLSEADFRDHVVRPLFLRRGLRDGRDLCGPREAGKDALFLATNVLDQEEIYVVQTKKGNITLAAKATNNLHNLKAQLRTALDEKVTLLNPHRKAFPGRALLCASGHINDAAKNHITSDLSDPRLSFMDADDLVPLIDEHYPEFWLGVDANLAPYLRSVRRSIETTHDVTGALSDDTRSPASAATNDMFVPLHVYRVTLRVVKRHGKIEKEPKFDDTRVENLLRRREKRILLVGGAGSGKSTCLRRLAYITATDALSERGSPTIPILLKARDVVGNARPLVEQCHSETRRVAGTDQPAFSVDDLNAGRILLMIDALDEVPSDDERQRAIHLIGAFSAQYPKCRIFVACRPLSSMYDITGLGEFAEFRMSAIGIRGARQLVKRLHRKGRLSATQMTEILRRLQDVHGVELSPLLVTVFVSTTEYSRRDIPANITELFKKYTEMMLGRWDVTKGVGLQYQATLKDFVLRQVAFRMHREREVEIRLHDLKKHIASELAERGHEASVETLTEELIGRSGLFRQSDDRIGFRHHVLQEFFAGRAIESRKFLESTISDDWWRRAIVFYFGENPSDGVALEEVRAAVAQRTGRDRYAAALTLGLCIQACYLVGVDPRKKALAWVIATLAVSQGEFLEATVQGGGRRMLSALRYYLLGRDSVSAQIIGGHHQHIAQIVEDVGGADEPVANPEGEAGQLDIRRFWVIVGLIEAGFLDEAEEYIEQFHTDNQTLELMLYLGCVFIREMRTTSSKDRKTVDRIVARLLPRVQGLRRRLLEEFSSELLEMRGAAVKTIESSTSGVDREQEKVT